jgi:hypothetical protein
LRKSGDSIGERDRLLIDLQFFEHEGHAQAYTKMSSGSGEQETAGQQIERPSSSSRSFTCSPVPLLSCSIFGRFAAKNGG